jgi:diadenylate cyclase
MWSRNTRIVPIITGLFLLGVIFLFARVLNLKALEWILDKFLTMLVIAIPIVLSDELRRLLEKLGQLRLFRRKSHKRSSVEWIKHLVDFVYIAKSQKMGALLVLERKTLLTDYIEDAKPLNAKFSKELLISIFNHNSPLHDGAVIVRSGVISCACAILPISTEYIENVGTRHRAAIGISNKSDAIVVVVSEERGIVSIAMDGKLQKNISKSELELLLNEVFEKKSSNKKTLIKQFKDIFHV